MESNPSQIFSSDDDDTMAGVYNAWSKCSRKYVCVCKEHPIAHACGTIYLSVALTPATVNYDEL